MVRMREREREKRLSGSFALLRGIRGHRSAGEDVPPLRTKSNERSQFRLFMIIVRKRLSTLDFRRVLKTRMALDNVARNRESRPGTFAGRKSTLRGLALHQLLVIGRADGEVVRRRSACGGRRTFVENTLENVFLRWWTGMRILMIYSRLLPDFSHCD
jgi:hypothetical protein